VDRPARPFAVPDGLPAAGLFGGGFVLAALAILGLTDGPSGPVPPPVLAVGLLGALGLVVGSGIVLLRRLRGSAETLERRTREVEEAASRLQVLI